MTTGTITTVTGTGNGEELLQATEARRPQPHWIYHRSCSRRFGEIYLADRHNQRIRRVILTPKFSTLTGSGAASLAGGRGGDGASAATATLSKPTGVSVDAAGDVYVADTNNQRIRQIASGTIATVAGAGDQGFGGDGGAATVAILDAPHAVVPDTLGNLVIADTRNDVQNTLGLVRVLCCALGGRTEIE